MTMTTRRPSKAAPPNPNQLAAYRPNRNYVRVGDAVRVAEGHARQRAFNGRVITIVGPLDAAGLPRWVDVCNPRTGNVHAVTPDRINRRAQSKAAKR